MTAFGSMNTNSFSYCSMAAAGSSARILPILDTAISLVVSICVLCLGLLRIMMPIM